jgi:photosystem II stability/assembly factor-like uncharacterized protein
MEERGMSRTLVRKAILTSVVILTASLHLPAQQIDRKTLGGLSWRLVGPYRGGRVEAVAGVPGTTIFYFGAVAGGVWKSEDAGQSWNPIFDGQPIASIGAIAIAPSDPNVIYVGTGEPCLRGDISYGNGVYKSTDGGKTWTHLGLDDTRHIAKILVDPHDPNLVLVAAIGHAYGPNPERGVFRSTDGGKTWQKALYHDDRTGAVDLVFDPNNPRIVYAALYQVVRLPWEFISGGPGSGIYKSTDEGQTWVQIKGNGLPEGVWGRIGLAVGANSQRVYALIEAEKGGLYVSDDAGEHWHLVNDDHRFRQRAWYFTHIFADPKDTETVYILNTGLYRSTDGGHSWKTIREPHGDNHALWIDPTDPRRLMVGNDGGAAVSLNGGQSWSSQMNQPTAQFYHVAADDRFPYFIYGAQQDNSTVAIASVGNPAEFYAVGGGESGWIVPEPDGQTVYAGSYDGLITRFDAKTRLARDVSPWPLNPMGHGAAELKYRFQWTAPIAASPFDPKTIYFGGNVLFKTTNGGQSWTVISPDLTRNDKSKQQPSGGPITKDNTSVEYYDTIFTIAPSPLRRGLIWVGTDDGLVQLTQDEGEHWTNVTPRDLPEWSKISLIEASHHQPGTAYVAVDRSKNDDFEPYIYKTSDFGRSWAKITTGIPAGAYVHAVREDPVRPGLLFAGTELGVYISFDDGAHWQSLQLNLPVTPVHDLIVKGNDLVVATHGRAFWILSAVDTLRQLGPSTFQEPVHLFRPAPAYRARLASAAGFGPAGNLNAAIDYWLQQPPKDDVTLEILDRQGHVVRRFTTHQRQEPTPESIPEEFAALFRQPVLTKNAGLNRFVWDLRYQPARTVPGLVTWGGRPVGPLVPPGTYQVRLTVEGKSFTVPLEVRPDPRLNVSTEDYQKQLALELDIQREVNAAHQAVREIRSVHEQLTALVARLEQQKAHQELVNAMKKLDQQATAIENRLVQTRSKSNEDPLNYPIMLADQMMALGSTVDSVEGAPPEQDYTVFRELKAGIDEQLSAWQTLKQKDLAALNEQLTKAGIPFVGVPSAPTTE